MPTKNKDKLYQLMTKLGLPSFKTTEVEFIAEYIDVLTPIAIAIDRLQCENGILRRITSNFTCSRKQTAKLKYEGIEVLQTMPSENFLSLVNEATVHDAIIGTHPYFKLKWGGSSINLR